MKISVDKGKTRIKTGHLSLIRVFDCPLSFMLTAKPIQSGQIARLIRVYWFHMSLCCFFHAAAYLGMTMIIDRLCLKNMRLQQ